MRVFSTSLFLVFLLLSCVDALKILEAGEYDRAYKVSKRQLDQRMRRDKPAANGTLVTLHDSYLALQDRAIRQIGDLQAEAHPGRWLRIYPLYIELLDRHVDVQPYAHLYPEFPFRYDQPSLERLMEHVRLAAGDYCFQKAASSFLAARANQKLAAREAYAWLLRALEYVPEDDSYRNHLAEMRDLGTVRVLVQAIGYLNPNWHSLEASFASASSVLYNGDWLQINYLNAGGWRIDYEATLDVTSLYVSMDYEDRSSECFSAEVITGYRTETKSEWQDSVWVKVEEEVPIYETVTATITTVEQYKEATASGQIQIIPVAGLRPGGQWGASEYVDWSNTFEICSGDERALPSSCSGSDAFHPSDWDMVHQLACALRGSLIRRIGGHFPILN